MRKAISIGCALVALVGSAFGQTFTDLSGPAHRGKTDIRALATAIDANFALLESGNTIDGSFDALDVDNGATIKGTVTSISTNGATTNVIVTTGGQLDASKVADADLGDISTSSGSYTLDNDVVAAAEMADADHGDVAWSGGVATVQSVGGTFTITASALNVTNTQAITVAAGAYVLNGIGQADNFTNTVTLAAPAAAGELVYLMVATASSNLVTIADSGTVAASGAILLDGNDSAVLMAVDTSTWVLLSESDN